MTEMLNEIILKDCQEAIADKPQLRLLIYHLCTTHLDISKARTFFAAVPKHEQIN